MQLLEDGIVAALAAIGLASLFCLLFASFSRRRCRCGLDAVVVVPCRAGEGARLEQTVRALERARYEYGGFRTVVILDRGMDADAKKIAALLCRDGYDVTYRNHLSQLYELEQLNGRTGEHSRHDRVGDLSE